MLFPVNRETRKLIAVIRDLLFLIAVNCAQDPPLRPLPKGPVNLYENTRFSIVSKLFAEYYC